MERLTKVDDQGRLLAYLVSDTGLPLIVMRGNPYHKLIERLRDYEDIGLEPEEIKPYIELSEKMNLCDLVRENKRLSNKIRFLETKLIIRT